MPDGYQKVPRPESIKYFEDSTQRHSNVISVENTKGSVYDVSRYNSPLRVHLTNIYIVGIADVHEILAHDADVNCIVTISAWNSYTQEAKDYCIASKIGLFKFREYYGALNFEGDKFLDYILPEDRGDE